MLERISLMPILVIVLLRAVHVVTACIWVGVAVFNAFYLIPSIIASGPAGGQVMRVLAQQRRLPVFINVISGLVLLSGLGLYDWASSHFSLNWILSRPGLAFTCGALLAFATSGVAMSLTVPTVNELGRVSGAMATAGGPPSPAQLAELGVLQQRLLLAARISAVFVATAALLMGIARYL